MPFMRRLLMLGLAPLIAGPLAFSSAALAQGPPAADDGSAMVASFSVFDSVPAPAPGGEPAKTANDQATARRPR